MIRSDPPTFATPRPYIVLLALLCAVFLCACTKQETRNEQSADEYTIIDSLHREVRVKKDPERIAAIFSPAAHTIAMLGEASKIQSISSGNLRDRLLLELHPELVDVRTPKGGGQFNIEELVKAPAPDLILADAATVSDQSLLRKIEKFGIPVVAYDFKTIDEQKEAIRMVGTLLSKEDRADAYCERSIEASRASPACLCSSAQGRPRPSTMQSTNCYAAIFGRQYRHRRYRSYR